MFKHILMPTDGSEHSEKAIERGVELAKLCGAKVTGIHVVPDYQLMIAYEGAFDPAMQEKVSEEARERAASFLEFVQQTADKAGVPCDTIVATNDRPYNAIVNTANERGCDLIVMTARYRKGLASLIMSSESTKVLHRASIPVLTFRALMSADHPDKLRANGARKAAKAAPGTDKAKLSSSV
jgi:nucleotide-binding universal stress UspA family protein